jgi:hypothetical protein
MTKKDIDITEIDNIPIWALCYIINDDNSGLTENEINQVNKSLESIARYNIDTTKKVQSYYFTTSDNDDESFCHHPAFGLACNVVKMNLVILYE